MRLINFEIVEIHDNNKSKSSAGSLKLNVPEVKTKLSDRLISFNMKNVKMINNFSFERQTSFGPIRKSEIAISSDSMKREKNKHFGSGKVNSPNRAKINEGSARLHDIVSKKEFKTNRTSTDFNQKVDLSVVKVDVNVSKFEPFENRGGQNRSLVTFTDNGTENHSNFNKDKLVEECERFRKSDINFTFKHQCPDINPGVLKKSHTTQNTPINFMKNLGKPQVQQESTLERGADLHQNQNTSFQIMVEKIPDIIAKEDQRKQGNSAHKKIGWLNPTESKLLYEVSPSNHIPNFTLWPKILDKEFVMANEQNDNMMKLEKLGLLSLQNKANGSYATKSWVSPSNKSYYLKNSNGYFGNRAVAGGSSVIEDISNKLQGKGQENNTTSIQNKPIGDNQNRPHELVLEKKQAIIEKNNFISKCKANYQLDNLGIDRLTTNQESPMKQKDIGKKFCGGLLDKFKYIDIIGNCNTNFLALQNRNNSTNKTSKKDDIIIQTSECDHSNKADKNLKMYTSKSMSNLKDKKHINKKKIGIQMIEQQNFMRNSTKDFSIFKHNNKHNIDCYNSKEPDKKADMYLVNGFSNKYKRKYREKVSKKENSGKEENFIECRKFKQKSNLFMDSKYQSKLLLKDNKNISSSRLRSHSNKTPKK